VRLRHGARHNRRHVGIVVFAVCAWRFVDGAETSREFEKLGFDDAGAGGSSSSSSSSSSIKLRNSLRKLSCCACH
jgi:hypothetical protein